MLTAVLPGVFYRVKLNNLRRQRFLYAFAKDYKHLEKDISLTDFFKKKFYTELKIKKTGEFLYLCCV